MNSRGNVLVTVASWEERCALGTERLLQSEKYEAVVMFFFSEYQKWSARNRFTIRELCAREGIRLEEHDLSFETYAESWERICSVVDPGRLNAKRYTIDITTMPRETMWTIFWRIQRSGVQLRYVYHRPEKYGDWLTREPGSPRLVFKLSGVAKLGSPTKLLILTGFDIERVEQLMDYFEPEATALGLQVGTQYDNCGRNAEKHRERYRTRGDVEFFEVDAYAEDRGAAAIGGQLQNMVGDANVVVASIGPKVSAVTLFHMQRLWPDIGLVYAPAKEFNKEYSEGIGESLWGDVYNRIPKEWQKLVIR